MIMTFSCLRKNDEVKLLTLLLHIKEFLASYSGQSPVVVTQAFWFGNAFKQILGY